MKTIAQALLLTLITATFLGLAALWLVGPAYLISLGRWWSIPLGVFGYLFPIALIVVTCVNHSNKTVDPEVRNG